MGSSPSGLSDSGGSCPRLVISAAGLFLLSPCTIIPSVFPASESIMIAQQGRIQDFGKGGGGIHVTVKDRQR